MSVSLSDVATPILPEAKATVLIEALPWLQSFHGAVVVIKYGGNAMLSNKLISEFAQDMVFLRLCGLQPVVVHGGGPQINTMLDRLGIKSEFQTGLRITSPQAMDVIRMVLVGQVGRSIVSAINKIGPYAVGLSGEDAGLFTAERKRTVIEKQHIDLGLVGDIAAVQPDIIFDTLHAGRIPVISPVASDINGVVHNINADTAAAALAVAIKAKKLIVLSDVAGLYARWPDTSSLISTIDSRELTTILGDLDHGMLPKMRACLHAVKGGVPRAHIIDGRKSHAILREIFTSSGTGTMVVPTGEE